MGNISTQATQGAKTSSKKGPGGENNSQEASLDCLFIEDQVIYEADWGKEAAWTRFQRLLGFDIESENENRKKQQKIVLFVPGSKEYKKANDRDVLRQLGLGEHAKDSVTLVQRFYRAYRCRIRWKYVVHRILDLVRREMHKRRVILAHENDAHVFRQILQEGFDALKLSSGSDQWKAVRVKFTLKPFSNECYLTWQPCSKLTPKIHFHEIEQVVAMKKSLSNLVTKPKVEMTTRKAMLIQVACMSDGQLVLQLPTAQERDTLVAGFQKALAFMNAAPTKFDLNGIPRQQRREQAVLFFDEQACQRRTQQALSQVRLHHAASSPSFTSSSSRVLFDVEKNQEINPFNSFAATTTVEDTKQGIDLGYESSRNEENQQQLKSFFNTRFDEAMSPRTSKRSSPTRYEETFLDRPKLNK